MEDTCKYLLLFTVTGFIYFFRSTAFSVTEKDNNKDQVCSSYPVQTRSRTLERNPTLLSWCIEFVMMQVREVKARGRAGRSSPSSSLPSASPGFCNTATYRSVGILWEGLPYVICGLTKIIKCLESSNADCFRFFSLLFRQKNQNHLKGGQ